jgi:hypothetical protein
MARITLSMVGNQLSELIDACGDDPEGWDRVFFMVARAKQRFREPRRKPRPKGLRYLCEVENRLQQLCVQLLGEGLDEMAGRTCEAIRSDLRDVNTVYSRHKEERLRQMGAPGKGAREETAEERAERKVKARLLGSAERQKERYLGLSEAPDPSGIDRSALGDRRARTLAMERGFMLSTRIEPGQTSSWLRALAGLAIYRKRMQEGSNMFTFMHRKHGGMYFSFTHLELGDLPTGVYICNTKDDKGEGATRVVSFVDAEGEIYNPDFDNVALESLLTVDISYLEIFDVLEEIKTTFMGDSDSALAAFLLGLLGEAPCPDLAKVFPRCLATKPKIKKLLSNELVALPGVTLPVGTMCMTLLAILFLTEPKHAMPMWTANCDALHCIALGYLNFEQLLRTQMVFSDSLLSGDVEIRLHRAWREDLVSIGSLLASGNTAATTLSPALRHTRKLKELIMPACEEFFDASRAVPVALLLKKIDAVLGPGLYDHGEVSPWFVEALDWSEDAPDVVVAMKNKDRVKKVVRPNRDLSGGRPDRLVQIRKLTFIAPIVKILVLREIRLSRKWEWFSE